MQLWNWIKQLCIFIFCYLPLENCHQITYFGQQVQTWNVILGNIMPRMYRFLKCILTSMHIWCLLLLGTWSYLRICRRSVLPYTRFCNCLLDYGYVLHIVNFAILYVTFNEKSRQFKKKIILVPWQCENLTADGLHWVQFCTTVI
jgi:hypothetical protein